MKHLGVLEGASLITLRREGRERWNFLNAIPLKAIYERWIRPYEARWAGSLLRLKRVAEEPKGEETMVDAAVSESGPKLLRIEQEVRIAAPRARVFEALTRDVAAWWGPPYSCTEKPQAIVLEPEIGGRFYETGANGDRYLWATVTAIDRGTRLELTGPFGMRGAVYGVFSFALEEDGEATVLRLSHRAVGEVTEQTAASYTGGWQDLLGTRLRRFVEEGERLGLAR